MLIAMSRSLVFSVRFDKESIQDDGTIGKRWRTKQRYIVTFVMPEEVVRKAVL